MPPPKNSEGDWLFVTKDALLPLAGTFNRQFGVLLYFSKLFFFNLIFSKKYLLFVYINTELFKIIFILFKLPEFVAQTSG